MEHLKQALLESRLKEALKEHQHDGLHMIGGADQLVHRLVRAVEGWLEEQSSTLRKSA